MGSRRRDTKAELPSQPAGSNLRAASSIGEWCNGSTTGSEPVSLGSNPSSPVLIPHAPGGLRWQARWIVASSLTRRGLALAGQWVAPPNVFVHQNRWILSASHQAGAARKTRCATAVLPWSGFAMVLPTAAVIGRTGIKKTGRMGTGPRRRAEVVPCARRSARSAPHNRPGYRRKVGVTGQVMSPENRGLFLVTSLIEEAITSSQLESAVTTRKVAAAMIRTGRKPWGVSGEYGDVVHTPPIATELTKRMAQMCDFANSQTLEFFVHPVVRGIILHFLLAFDHPFIDGNGRTARALF